MDIVSLLEDFYLSVISLLCCCSCKFPRFGVNRGALYLIFIFLLYKWLNILQISMKSFSTTEEVLPSFVVSMLQRPWKLDSGDFCAKVSQRKSFLLLLNFQELLCNQVLTRRGFYPVGHQVLMSCSHRCDSANNKAAVATSVHENFTFFS